MYTDKDSNLISEQTVTFIYLTFAVHVPVGIMTLKYHICKLVHMQI